MKPNVRYTLPFILAFVLFLFDYSGWSSGIRRPVSVIATPIKERFVSFRHSIDENIIGFVSFGTLRKTLTEKERILSRVMVDYAELERLKKENDVLKKQLVVGFPVHTTITGAISIGATSTTITIDSTEGRARVGMPVIVEKNLVGVVHQVFGTTALVYLLNHPESKIAVQTSEGSRGLLVGRGGELLGIEKIASSDPFAVGTIVVTSGSEEIPSGLVVGTVSRVQFSEQELFKEGVVIPALSYDQLERVFVVSK